jgi:hypothetical protein
MTSRNFTITRELGRIITWRLPAGAQRGGKAGEPEREAGEGTRAPPPRRAAHTCADAANAPRFSALCSDFRQSASTLMRTILALRA